MSLLDLVQETFAKYLSEQDPLYLDFFQSHDLT